MSKQEWLRLKPYAREIHSNPRGGWSNMQGRRAVKGRGKGVGGILRDSRVIPSKVRYIRATTSNRTMV